MLAAVIAAELLSLIDLAETSVVLAVHPFLLPRGTYSSQDSLT
jgi:hypothetical protein